MVGRVLRIRVSIATTTQYAAESSCRCSQLFCNGLLEKIEEILERIPSLDVPCSIEQLSVDIGVISLSSFEVEFTRGLLEKLTNQLRSNPLLLSARHDDVDVGEQAMATLLGGTRKTYSPVRERYEALSRLNALTDAQCRRLAPACLRADLRQRVLRDLSRAEQYALCRRMQTAALAAERGPVGPGRSTASLNEAHVLPESDASPLSPALAEALLVIAALIQCGAAGTHGVPALAGQHVRVPSDARLAPWLRGLFDMPSRSTPEWTDWLHMLSRQPESQRVRSIRWGMGRNESPVSRHSAGNDPTHAVHATFKSTIETPYGFSHLVRKTAEIGSIVEDGSSADAVRPHSSPLSWGAIETRRGSSSPLSKRTQIARRPVSMRKPEEAFESVSVANAGVVLLWPLLPELFSGLGLLDAAGFVDRLAQHRAAHWLDMLIWGNREYDARRIGLTSVLCGLPYSEPVRYEEPTPKEIALAISNWLSGLPARIPGLERCTVADVRELFLQRGGMLAECDDHFELEVTPHASDFLLVDVPWSMTAVPWAWLACPLHVRWPVPVLPMEARRSGGI